MREAIRVEVQTFDNREDVILLNVFYADESIDVEAVDTLQLQSRILELLGVKRLVDAGKLKAKT